MVQTQLQDLDATDLSPRRMKRHHLLVFYFIFPFSLILRTAAPDLLLNSSDIGIGQVLMVKTTTSSSNCANHGGTSTRFMQFTQSPTPNPLRSVSWICTQTAKNGLYIALTLVWIPKVDSHQYNCTLRSSSSCHCFVVKRRHLLPCSLSCLLRLTTINLNERFNTLISFPYLFMWHVLHLS